jgi:hypothetical protein
LGVIGETGLNFGEVLFDLEIGVFLIGEI